MHEGRRITFTTNLKLRKSVVRFDNLFIQSNAFTLRCARQVIPPSRIWHRVTSWLFRDFRSLPVCPKRHSGKQQHYDAIDNVSVTIAIIARMTYRKYRKRKTGSLVKTATLFWNEIIDWPRISRHRSIKANQEGNLRCLGESDCPGNLLKRIL